MTTTPVITRCARRGCSHTIEGAPLPGSGWVQTGDQWWCPADVRDRRHQAQDDEVTQVYDEREGLDQADAEAAEIHLDDHGTGGRS